MCIWHSVGKCRNGESCRFAHGKDELRGILSEEQDQASKAASKTNKAKKKVDEKLPQEEICGNVSNSAPKETNSKTRAARRAAAKKMIEAHKTKEDNLAPVDEASNAMFNQPMFVQSLLGHLGGNLPQVANSGYSSDFQLPGSVTSKLLKESGFLDSLRGPGANAGVAPPPPPPGLQQSIDSADFNIIPDTWSRSFEQGNDVQKTNPTYQEITSLASSIQSLSEQLKTLQLAIAHQHLQKTGNGNNAKVKGRSLTGQGSQGYSESTKSGSDFNHSSNGSSPPSTPGNDRDYFTHQEKLAQLSQFSRELQLAFGSNMSMLSNPDLMAWHQQQQQMQQMQQMSQGLGM
jgi:hypothetical protein